MSEIKTRIANILQNYMTMKREVQVLIFELQRFASNLHSETIQNLTFSHSNSERVSGSRFSDKTANIAIEHYDSQINGEYHVIRTLINNMQFELSRIDYYLSLIPDDEALVLKLFYFERVTVVKISETVHRSQRTVHRMKDNAFERLTHYYTILDKMDPDSLDIRTRMRFIGYIHEERFSSCLERTAKNKTPGIEAMLYILCGCNELWQVGIETLFDFESGVTIKYASDALSDNVRKLLSLAFHLANSFDRNNLVRDLRYYFPDLEYVHLELAIEALKAALFPGNISGGSKK